MAEAEHLTGTPASGNLAGMQTQQAGQVYDEDYYLRGVAKGISNYTDYRWMEERTMAMAKRLIEVMGIRPGDRFLDFGCARGFAVKALRRLGVDAWGSDISKWAVENCDAEVRGYVHNDVQPGGYDHVLLKDLAEHLEPAELLHVIDRLLSIMEKSMLLVVPLSAVKDGPYVREEDNKDVTHIVRWPLEEWLRFLQRPGDEFVLTASWHIPGLKPTSLSSPESCGFIMIRRG